VHPSCSHCFFFYIHHSRQSMVTAKTAVFLVVVVENWMFPASVVFASFVFYIHHSRQSMATAKTAVFLVVVVKIWLFRASFMFAFTGHFDILLRCLYHAQTLYMIVSATHKNLSYVYIPYIPSSITMTSRLKYPCRRRTMKRCRSASKSCRVVAKSGTRRAYCRKTRNRRHYYGRPS